MRALAGALSALLGMAVSSTQAAIPPTPTVHVGDGTLDGSFLKPYNNAWTYTVRLSDGRVVPQGIWSDRLQWTSVDGKPAMLRVQGVTFIKGLSSVTLNVFDPKSMAPISSEAHHIDGTIFKRSFDGAHVETTTLANAKDTASPKASQLPQAVYDFNGGLYGLLLAALPLKAGLAGSLPAIADDSDSMTAEPFRVLREEMVSAGARGRVKAWVVESAKPGQYIMTFWIAKRPPYIIRLVMTNEVNHSVLSWDMI